MVRLQHIFGVQALLSLTRLNSTMVRLQLTLYILMDLRLQQVSIPLWFDYNQRFSNWYAFKRTKVSIPLWFDYNFYPETRVLLEPLKSQFHYGSITT